MIVMWNMVYDFDFSRSLFLYSLVPTVCEKISTAVDAFVLLSYIFLARFASYWNLEFIEKRFRFSFYP